MRRKHRDVEGLVIVTQTEGGKQTHEIGIRMGKAVISNGTGKMQVCLESVLPEEPLDSDWCEKISWQQFDVVESNPKTARFVLSGEILGNDTKLHCFLSQ